MTTTTHDGNLGSTLATWLFQVHAGGRTIAHDEIRAACVALESLPADATADAQGQVLVGTIRKAFGKELPSFAEVTSHVASWLGVGAVGDDLGAEAERDERIRAIRRYVFSHKGPWIARIIDRFPDGRVGEHWVLVREVGEQVRILDPYPWDGVDEEYVMPLQDFMVKWELAGRESLRLL